MFQKIMNFMQSPKTTLAGLLGGSAAGASALAAMTMISSQAGCDFSHVDWVLVAKVLFVSGSAGTLVGGVMQDTTKASESVERGAVAKA